MIIKNLINKDIIVNNSFEFFLKDNYTDKIIEIKRVTKVVKGGKKFKFRVIVICGDYNEKVGLGIGKSEDTNIAIEKAILNARKNIIFVPLTLQKSIPFFLKFSSNSCKIILKPALSGIGLKAGSSIRTVLELSGIKNIIAKRFGSNNLLNNAKTTIMALKFLHKKINIKKKIFNKYCN